MTEKVKTETLESLEAQHAKLEAQIAKLRDDERAAELQAEAQAALADVASRLAEARRLDSAERRKRVREYAKAQARVGPLEEAYTALNAEAEAAYVAMVEARDKYVAAWAAREELSKESRAVSQALREAGEPDQKDWRQDAPKAPASWTFDTPRRRWRSEALWPAKKRTGLED